MTHKKSQITLAKLVEDPETLLALEPGELANFVLKDLIAREGRPGRGNLNRNNYSLLFRSRREDVQRAIMQAWASLEQKGYIAPKPMSGPGWVFVTPQGKQAADSPNRSKYGGASVLAKEFLHSVIAEKVWPALIRGEYDTAVLQAFKQVEVAVRHAGSFGPDDIGVQLMRKAFHPDKGPLTDKKVVKAERQALMDLFAGAIGLYKNPHSHRNVTINDPDETAEMITLASHLLRIVDSLAPKPPPPP